MTTMRIAQRQARALQWCTAAGLFVSLMAWNSLIVIAQDASVGRDQHRDGGELLRWQFNEGRVFIIEMRTTDHVTTPTGEKYRNERNYQLTWTVRNVNEDGMAEIAVRFDRAQWRLELPSFEYDSQSENPTLEPTEAPELRTTAFAARALANAELTCLVAPDGGIARLGGGESLVAPMSFTPGDWPALPEKRVSVGDVWKVDVGASVDPITMRGTCQYRIQSVKDVGERRLVRIDGESFWTEWKHPFGNGSTIQPTTTTAMFDLSAGLVVEEESRTKSQLEVSPNEFINIETTVSRKIIRSDKRSEVASRSGEYLIVFKEGEPTFVTIAGMEQNIPDSARQVSELLEVDFYHDWKDKDQDNIHASDELIGVNNRFSTQDRVNIYFVMIGLQNAKLRFEVLDCTGESKFANEVGIRGPRAIANRSIGGFRAGMYFFVFYLNDKYLMRVPVQVSGTSPHTMSPNKVRE